MNLVVRRKTIATAALCVGAIVVVGIVLVVPVASYTDTVGLKCPSVPNFVDDTGIPCGPPYIVAGSRSEGSILFNLGGYTSNGTYHFGSFSLPSVGNAEISQCGFVTSCSADNPSGLALTLSVSTNFIQPNGSFNFQISEFNPTTSTINMSREDKWYINGLDWPCNNGSIPYGIEAFMGHYTLQNVSSAKNVLRFAIILCLSTSNPSSFVIPPLSAFSPSYGFSNSSIYATDVGFIRSGATEASVNWLGSDKPATYTIAAGDEWGDFALLYVSVRSGS